LTSAYKKIPANYFQPGLSIKLEAEIRIEPNMITIVLPDNSVQKYLLDTVRFSDRVGNTPCTIRLPDGGLVEIFDNEALDNLLGFLPVKTRGRFVHLVETKWPYMLASLAAIAASMVIILWFGVPLLSKTIAEKTPRRVSEMMTDKIMAIFDNRLLSPSGLTKKTQARYTRYFRKMTSRLDKKDAFDFRLLFREGNAIGANALAMPDGRIIITDELVRLISNEPEFAGVMAHEAGHVVHHHGLRMALQGSMAAIIMIFLTGDMLSSSSIIAAMPGILVERGYSRDFEREADLFALRYMKNNGIQPKHLASLLLKIERQQNMSDNSSILSTHPPTSERIQLLK